MDRIPSKNRVLFCMGILVLEMVLATLAQEKSPEASPAPEVTPSTGRVNHYLSRKVWETRIQAPETRGDTGGQDLRSLIDRLQAVQVQPPAPPAEPAVAVSPGIDANTLPATPTPAPTDPRPIPPRATAPIATGRLSVETLASLRALSVADLTAEQALPLADLLYTTGYLDIAGPLYGRAVERMDPNSPLFPENRAWALFQWGNCLRDTDPAGAIAAYQRLTVDYPQAPWTPMAKAWQDLADWYWREKPVRTLQEVTQPAPRTAEATTQDNGDAQS